jgi:hypothetical protein
VALNAAILVASVALAAGAVLLLAWIRAPIVEAKRLAAELDPPQEATFKDPNDGHKLCVLQLLHPIRMYYCRVYGL